MNLSVSNPLSLQLQDYVIFKNDTLTVNPIFNLPSHTPTIVSAVSRYNKLPTQIINHKIRITGKEATNDVFQVHAIDSFGYPYMAESKIAILELSTLDNIIGFLNKDLLRNVILSATEESLQDSNLDIQNKLQTEVFVKTYNTNTLSYDLMDANLGEYFNYEIIRKNLRPVDKLVFRINFN